jgi:diaminohydroxyphosphoribosylaminopyrimidine deaminase/5-amino-6-(5-phosphoribosylamino)uracil reductase
MMDDERWMKRVLRLAEKGKGRTSPNPMVGAVVVKHGSLVGEAYHRRAGEAHAEVLALQRAGGEAQGATLYLNLEPCTHHGRTPPCVPTVIEAGVSQVVIGMEDPNPLVKGRGVASLQTAGLDVRVGILQTECRRLNEAFCKYIVTGKPFVILKVAATLDGKISTRTGNSKWISSEASRHMVHRLRNEIDGVIVGIGTVLKDDPLLTARIRGGRDPFRIILDSRLRIPDEAAVLRTSPEKTVVATTEMAPKDRASRLEEKGVHVLILESKDQRIDLNSLLGKLGEMEMMSLLVEGGSRVNGSFLDEGLVDKVLFFLSPRLIGDCEALGIFGGKGAIQLEEAIPVRDLRIRKVGGDILIEGYVSGETHPCSPAS